MSMEQFVGLCKCPHPDRDHFLEGDRYMCETTNGRGPDEGCEWECSVTRHPAPGGWRYEYTGLEADELNVRTEMTERVLLLGGSHDGQRVEVDRTVFMRTDDVPSDAEFYKKVAPGVYVAVSYGPPTGHRKQPSA